MVTQNEGLIGGVGDFPALHAGIEAVEGLAVEEGDPARVRPGEGLGHGRRGGHGEEGA